MVIGDVVVLLSEGSWVHGMLGTVHSLCTTSSDGIKGVGVTVPGHGWTVVDPSELVAIRNSDQWAKRDDVHRNSRT